MMIYLLAILASIRLKNSLKENTIGWVLEKMLRLMSKLQYKFKLKNSEAQALGWPPMIANTDPLMEGPLDRFYDRITDFN